MDSVKTKRKSSPVIEDSQTSDKNVSNQIEPEKNVETTGEESLKTVSEDLEHSKEEEIVQEPEKSEAEEHKDDEKEKSVIISEPTQAMREEMTQERSDNTSTQTKVDEAMAFWRRGGMHVQNRTRCQDSAFCIGYDQRDPQYQNYVENHNKIKVVMDGCGSCEYSLIGVLMFEQEFKRKAAETQISPDNLEDIIKEIFQKMLRYDSEIHFIIDNYLFTILICFEQEDRFEVCTCGDGFILYVHNGQVFFKELEGGEKNEEGKVLPNYFAYDLDQVKGKLSNYKNGTEFELYTFEKEKFSNVGVASDGLRFCKSLEAEEKSQLFSMIYYRLPIGLERFLEKHKGLFMDDFSISI